MDQATRDWLRQHSISSWRRVGVAALLMIVSLSLQGFLQDAHPSVNYILVPTLLASFAFVGSSLIMTLVYKLPGAISARDLWHPFVRLVIRDVI